MRSSVKNKIIWTIALPIIFGNLAQTLIALTDTAFLGRVSAVALGASMMAGIYYYIYSTLAWGFAIGIQIIVARRLGEGRLDRIGVIFEHGLFFVLFLSTGLFLIQHYFTNDILARIIQSPNIYAAAVEYMDYRHYGIIFVCFNFLFRSLYIGLSDTKVISFTTAIMAMVNIFLDYVLIFGKFGVPEMGVGGAALASVCAEISATFFFIGYTLVKLPLKTYSLFYFHKLEGWLMKSVLKLAFPTMIQKLLSFGTWFIFFALVEHGRDTDCGVRDCEKCLYARYDPRICFRCNGQYAHQPPDRRRETKRSDADCLQNDRTRADRHSAGTLMLFVYPSYGAVYLHRRFGLSRCLYSFFAGYLLCFDRYELRNSTVRSRIRYR